MLKNTTQGWGVITRLIHWTMAILIVGTLGLGLYMVQIETDLINRYLQTQWHKSFGFTIFVLALVRIGWRLWSPAHPALPTEMQNWQENSAKISHYLLYILMLAIPITGWLLASASPLNDPDASPFQIKNMVFELFELPDPFTKGSQSVTDFLRFVHLNAALSLAILLVIHAGAALKHHFIDRDNVLRRMIIGR